MKNRLALKNEKRTIREGIIVVAKCSHNFHWTESAQLVAGTFRHLRSSLRSSFTQRQNLVEDADGKLVPLKVGTILESLVAGFFGVFRRIVHRSHAQLRSEE